MVVQVTDDLLSRASMTVVNGRPTLTINTSTARQHWLEGMLRHEIGGWAQASARGRARPAHPDRLSLPQGRTISGAATTASSRGAGARAGGGWA